MRSHSTDWIIDGDETALLSHHYQICDIIEKGPICTVYRATHRNTSKTFIVRSVDLRRHVAASGLSQEATEKEVEICALLKHPFFCQLRDVIAGANVVHMVFEYVEGSDICFEIVKRASSGFIYSEAVASHYVKQLCEACRFMHSLSIVHRDVRPHNVLLANKENNSPLKMRGFGIAYKLTSANDRCPPGRIGIPAFMAPEVVSGKPYGKPADLWSVGVVLYILLSGRLPFSGSQEYVFKCITEGKYSLTVQR
jgi:calcium/calmodulin-dependent serine protein kinase